MVKPIYLDYMSTTPIDPRVREKMLPYLGDVFGNPASRHYYGYAADAAVLEAKNQVANLVNCDPKNIIWTSGATEANNLAIKGAAYFYRHQGKHLVTCSTEHKSVLDTYKYLETEGFVVTYLTPASDGLINLDELEKALRHDTILVSIMQVNNEIGVIQDIAAISKITHSRGVLLHVDAAQSAGKIQIDLEKLRVDLMTLSGHKIYGPKGIGALYIRSQPKLHLMPQIHGGSEKNTMRAGTLATHQIVGMGEACAISLKEMPEENRRLGALRDQLWLGIEKLGPIYINGSTTNRIPSNLNLSFDGIDGELLLAALKDLAVSSASACIHNREPSYVLKALGVPDKLIQSSIRISWGRFSTEAEIDHTIKHLNQVVTKLRASFSR